MRYTALASDYDGTLAVGGKVSEALLADLQRLRQSGFKLILVTGRELPDLQATFPQYALFERVVVENGAVMYNPATQEERLLTKTPPDLFYNKLQSRGVKRLSRGRVIVSTQVPEETAVLEVIRDLGLELTLVFNKGAVMVLPSGVNKKTGLEAALKELALTPEETIGVGDAENDHAFLEACGYSVAVADALPTLKAKVDLVLTQNSGAGVQELIQKILSGSL